MTPRELTGGLPLLARGLSWFSAVPKDIFKRTGHAGDAVVNVYINQEKKFAFVEMRTVEEASNAMALDGIIFEVSI